jgi:hypothetical protein
MKDVKGVKIVKEIMKRVKARGVPGRSRVSA